MTLEYRIGDVFERLAEIPDGSIDLIVTSPPFLALRSYLPADHPDKHKEIGSEPTPAEFLDTLYALTAEWGRVLAPHGSICVELGDTYAGGKGSMYDDRPERNGTTYFGKEHERMNMALRAGSGWPLAKSLTGIPTLYPWGLAYGRNLLTGQPHDAGQWRIRNLIVWARPNPPVGALGDKFRPATSYITVACKGQRRYFDLDAVRLPGSPNTHARLAQGTLERPVNGKKADNPNNNFGSMNEIETAGAPPLDWHADDHPEDGDWLWKLSTQPYKGSHYACVDDQTEALTRDRGWQPHDKLEDGDVIATYDDETDTLRWEPATFHRYPFDGELVAINQRETVQRLTPNHRVIMRTRGGLTPRTIRADQLKTSHSVPLIADFDQRFMGGGPTKRWAELYGWFVTEGHMPPAGAKPRALIYQSESANPQHVERIRYLLRKTAANFDETRRERTYNGRPSVEVVFTIRGTVAQMLRDFGKSIPSDVLTWRDEPLRAFYGALIDGDGHRRTSSGREQFICKHKHDADMFQAICARLGMRSTITQRKEGTYSVTVGARRWATLRGTNGVAKGTTFERYTGTVWCPSVSTGYWLARRNGRPFITGNTFPLTLPKRLIEAMCPLKVCTVCGKPSERVVDVQGLRGVDFKNPKAGGNGNRGTGLNGIAPLPDTPITRTTVGWTDCGCVCGTCGGRGTHPMDTRSVSYEADRCPECKGTGEHAWRTGIVLDPFAGSGTTLEAAQAVGRHAIGIDLDSRNADLARERVGMFLTVEEGAA